MVVGSNPTKGAMKDLRLHQNRIQVGKQTVVGQNALDQLWFRVDVFIPMPRTWQVSAPVLILNAQVMK